MLSIYIYKPFGVGFRNVRGYELTHFGSTAFKNGGKSTLLRHILTDLPYKLADGSGTKVIHGLIEVNDSVDGGPGARKMSGFAILISGNGAPTGVHPCMQEKRRSCHIKWPEPGVPLRFPSVSFKN